MSREGSLLGLFDTFACTAWARSMPHTSASLCTDKSRRSNERGCQTRSTVSLPTVILCAISYRQIAQNIAHLLSHTVLCNWVPTSAERTTVQNIDQNRVGDAASEALQRNAVQRFLPRTVVQVLLRNPFGTGEETRAAQLR